MTMDPESSRYMWEKYFYDVAMKAQNSSADPGYNSQPGGGYCEAHAAERDYYRRQQEQQQQQYRYHQQQQQQQYYQPQRPFGNHGPWDVGGHYMYTNAGVPGREVPCAYPRPTQPSFLSDPFAPLGPSSYGFEWYVPPGSRF